MCNCVVWTACLLANTTQVPREKTCKCVYCNYKMLVESEVWSIISAVICVLINNGIFNSSPSSFSLYLSLPHHWLTLSLRIVENCTLRIEHCVACELDTHGSAVCTKCDGEFKLHTECTDSSSSSQSSDSCNDRSFIAVSVVLAVLLVTVTAVLVVALTAVHKLYGSVRQSRNGVITVVENVAYTLAQEEARGGDSEYTTSETNYEEIR